MIFSLCVVALSALLWINGYHASGFIAGVTGLLSVGFMLGVWASAAVWRRPQL